MHTNTQLISYIIPNKSGSSNANHPTGLVWQR